MSLKLLTQTILFYVRSVHRNLCLQKKDFITKVLIIMNLTKNLVMYNVVGMKEQRTNMSERLEIKELNSLLTLCRGATFS